MNASLLTEKLNSVFKVKIPYEKTTSINFWHGDFLEQTAKVCQNATPFSKVLVVYTSKSFLEFGKQFNLLLLEKMLKPISLIIEASEKECIKNLLLSIPENVRLIVTIDQELKEQVLYLAKSKGLKCVVALKSLTDRLINKNATWIEDVHYIFDKSFTFDPATEYSLCVGKIISLLDIRLNAYLKVFNDKELITERFLSLFNRLLNLKFETKGVLEQIVSIRVEAELLEEFYGLNSLELNHFQAIKVLEAFTKKAKTQPTNFLELLKLRSKEYGEDYLLLLKKHNENTNKLSYCKNLDLILEGLKAQAKRFLEYQNQIQNDYIKLGGKSRSGKHDIKKLKIKGVGGDINCVWFLTELGYI